MSVRNTNHGRSLLPLLLGLFAGAIAGGTASALILHRPRIAKAPAAAAEAAAEPDTTAQMARLERQVGGLAASLQQGREKAGAPVVSPTGATRAKGPAVSREEAHRAYARGNDEALAKHGQQPLDPAWAPRVSQHIQGRLQALQETADFKLESVDCRTSMCVATVEWSSRHAAADNHGELLSASFDLACGTRIYLPEAVDESRPFRTPLILDCARRGQRSELVQ